MTKRFRDIKPTGKRYEIFDSEIVEVSLLSSPEKRAKLPEVVFKTQAEELHRENQALKAEKEKLTVKVIERKKLKTDNKKLLAEIEQLKAEKDKLAIKAATKKKKLKIEIQQLKDKNDKLAIKAATKKKKLKTENKKLVETNQTLQEKLTVLETPAPQIPKDKIHTFLEKILAQSLVPNVLTDILLSTETENKFASVGRPPVEGSSKKQMRHVIPYTLTKELIDLIVSKAPSATNLLDGLMKSIVEFLHHDGLCLTESALMVTPLKKVKDTVVQSSKRVLQTDQDNYYLLDHAIESLFTPNTKKQASLDYKQKQAEFVTIALNTLKTAILDNNTKLLASEALTRFMFTLFNKKAHAAFPEEGNTLNYEIRLYESALEAKKGGKGFEVMTSWEIAEKLEQAGSSTALNGRIRIVDNEGFKVKESIKALSLLDTIIKKYNAKVDNSNDLGNYNLKYNFKLKLTNSAPQLTLKPYNTTLTVENLKTTTHYHIAKILYRIFDFKPLECKVFVTIEKTSVPANAVQVLELATGNNKKIYTIKDGKAYRKAAKDKAKGYNKDATFRSEETDVQLLAELASNHINFCKLPFIYFSYGFTDKEYSTNYIPIIKQAFFELLASDYTITNKEVFDNYINKDTTVKVLDFGAPNADITHEIMVAGDDGTHESALNFL